MLTVNIAERIRKKVEGIEMKDYDGYTFSSMVSRDVTPYRLDDD